MPHPVASCIDARDSGRRWHLLAKANTRGRLRSSGRGVGRYNSFTSYVIIKSLKYLKRRKQGTSLWSWEIHIQALEYLSDAQFDGQGRRESAGKPPQDCQDNG